MQIHAVEARSQPGIVLNCKAQTDCQKAQCGERRIAERQCDFADAVYDGFERKSGLNLEEGHREPHRGRLHFSGLHFQDKVMTMHLFPNNRLSVDITRILQDLVSDLLLVFLPFFEFGPQVLDFHAHEK